MKRRRKFFLTLCLVLALVALLSPMVYGYMTHRTQTVANTFTPAEVTCDITEAFDGKTKTAITVTNTGTTAAYIRVRLAFHYEDSKGNVVARNITPPTITPASGWKAAGDGFTYYYQTPVAPGKSTPNLLAAAVAMTPKVDTVTGTEYTYYPVMEVLAEAIQSLPETTVEESWDVDVTNGIIQ